MMTANFSTDDDLIFILANAEDSQDSAYNFLSQYELEAPCLLDSDKELYSAYHRSSDVFAPFPLHVVIDRNSIIRYLGFQNDSSSVLAKINELLAE